jgi:hypothetical protein
MANWAFILAMVNSVLLAHEAADTLAPFGGDISSRMEQLEDVRLP